ncbi:MAG: PilN domain-containing protein [Gammaproteobacteria bacterium]|nr:PilN domain-containing protein [Gammaproteobacteria bacterium]
MQQVNLYQPILRKQEKIFSAKTLLQGNLLVLVGLALIYLYTVLQTQGLQEQFTQAGAQRDHHLKRNAELLAQYPPRAKDGSLAPRIEAARATLQQKRTLLAAVTALGLEEEVHFSRHLTGLARQDLPELWLRRIFLQYGQQVELQGSASQADAVPRYLQRLASEEAFSGTAFHSVVIARSEKEAGRVDFTLGTRLPQRETRQ